MARPYIQQARQQKHGMKRRGEGGLGKNLKKGG